MVMRAGSPGMFGMMDVSVIKILVPVTEKGFAMRSLCKSLHHHDTHYRIG